tara:strand:+ start:427 stop:744 length:318 start_codon:yes stop_codon:yes gene_type:complete
MRSRLILVLIGVILIIGCANVKQDYQTFYHPEYKVIDRGALKVKVISQACSERFEDALSAAKRNAKFHLRSVVGNKKHGVKFKKVGNYIKDSKICVEMRASPLHH